MKFIKMKYEDYFINYNKMIIFFSNEYIKLYIIVHIINQNINNVINVNKQKAEIKTNELKTPTKNTKESEPKKDIKKEIENTNDKEKTELITPNPINLEKGKDNKIKNKIIINEII